MNVFTRLTDLIAPAERVPGMPQPDGDPAPDTRPLSLALQGGGAFGAFTWGVLDRLLAEDLPELDMISGASAGAMNAVVLASGLIEGGRAGARAKLARFWRRVSDSAPLGLTGARSQAAMFASTRMVSPYQFNPLNLNPLRTILAGEVDFEALRAHSPVRLLIATTRVSDGALRLFNEQDVTLDAVLASACLPLVHHAVEIEGEAYWDGGYASNPPVLQLVGESGTPRILVVQIIPTMGEDRPKTSPEIARRVDQITFNSSLRNELASVKALVDLSQQEGSDTALGRRLRDLKLDHLAADAWCPDLAEASALDLGWPFLTRLHEAGRAAGEAWLKGRTSPEEGEAGAAG